MQAHLLSLDDFGMPKVFDAENAMYIHIVYLLLLDPGKFQSHPEMGVGLRTKYRYNNEIGMIESLQNDIKNQIETYLPDLVGSDIAVGIVNDHTLGIVITTDDGTYALSYNQDEDSIEVATTYVLEQLLL